MSYEPTDESTQAELEEAADNNDIVKNDELNELMPDKTGYQIAAQLDYDEQQLKAANPDPYTKPRAAARQGRKTFNTGPKGVLTDHAEAQLKMRAMRIDDKIKRKNKVYMNIDGSKQVQAFSMKYDPKAKTKKDKSESKRDSDDDSDDDSELDSDNEDDAEALRIYKQAKLAEIDKYNARYGSCMEATAWTFEKQIEHAPKNVITVMHIYQDYMERCAEMNKSLSELSRAYPHVQFLRARSDRIALDDYPEIGLPTLIVWKNGNQIANFIAMQSQIETPFTAKKIQAFLIEKKILEESAIALEKPTASTKEEFVEKYGTKKGVSKQKQDDDSDDELDID